MASGQAERNLARLVTAFGFGVAVWAVRDLWSASAGARVAAGGLSPTWMGLLVGALLVALAFAAAGAVSVVRPSRLRRLVSEIESRARSIPHPVSWSLAWLLVLAALVFLLDHRFDTTQLLSIRILGLLSVSLVVAIVVPLRGWALMPRWALAAMTIVALYIAADRLTLVTDYPFALGWSEGNRLWDYSLYFGREAYTVAGEFAYPTYLTPGRHGLWGLAFLIPRVPIEVVRLWDAVLWVAPYLAFGAALVAGKRTSLDALGRWAFALWSLLFLTQGPIYAPLVISATILAIGFDPQRPGRSALVTALASLYAGLSRWTWLVAPAMLGGVWSLLSPSPGTPLLRRLRGPILVGLAGLAGTIGSQLVMLLAFPQPEAPFATTARQALLWYRLWPSVTNPMGIVPALLIAVSPIVVLFARALARRDLRWDGLQVLGTAAMSTAFLAVGLAASVKIGGGNNLHNLDMFLVGLVFLAGVALSSLADRVTAILERQAVLVALVVIVPTATVLTASPPLEIPDETIVAESLATVQEKARQASQEGEVLFIDQRQLFAFGHLPDVPLVMEYELKDLMNQAMGENTEYLARFYNDLARHRFSLIVADRAGTDFQGRFRPFGEENDAWVEHVALPLNEFYDLAMCLEEVGVCLYTPKE